MLPPQASGYDLGKHMMLQSHVVILVAFEGWTLVTRTLLLFPRIDGNGTLQKDYGSAKWIPFITTILHIYQSLWTPNPKKTLLSSNSSSSSVSSSAFLFCKPWQTLCRHFISKSRHILKSDNFPSLKISILGFPLCWVYSWIPLNSEGYLMVTRSHLFSSL